MRYYANYIGIKCPYFICETEKGITCEGYTDKAKTVKTVFESIADKGEHIEDFCSCFPNGCPLAHMVDEKYDEKGT